MLEKILNILYNFFYTNLIIICSIIIISFIISIINFFLNLIVSFILLLLKYEKTKEDIKKLEKIFCFLRYYIWNTILFILFILYTYYNKDNFFPFIISNYLYFIIFCIIKIILILTHMHWMVKRIKIQLLEEDYKEKQEMIIKIRNR